ncbi:MAG: hypothetical protein B6229_07795 [Spirochaetaceae bacterium 4572_7]|nr:MAG: hypothetical protein B6229_07795 [Spirochaetaceae bacterium 4572_7]
MTFFNGTKIRILPNLILSLSIIGINIISPSGLVLLDLGFIEITKGALRTGIDKSAMLIGLLYLSKNISNIDVKLPGEFGLTLRDTFYYFSQLTNGERVTFNGIMGQIDNKLLNLQPYSGSDVKNSKQNSFNLIKIITLAITVIGLIFNYK